MGRRNAPNAGAVIGWSVGVLVGLMLIVLFLPSYGRARESANRVKWASNLRQIGQAASIYASEHGGQLPPDLVRLLQTGDITAEIFICASSKVDKASGATTQQVVASLLAGNHQSYAWTGAGLTTNAPADVVLAFDLERHVPKDSATTTGGCGGRDDVAGGFAVSELCVPFPFSEWTVPTPASRPVRRRGRERGLHPSLRTR